MIIAGSPAVVPPGLLWWQRWCQVPLPFLPAVGSCPTHQPWEAPIRGWAVTAPEPTGVSLAGEMLCHTSTRPVTARCVPRHSSPPDTRYQSVAGFMPPVAPSRGPQVKQQSHKLGGCGVRSFRVGESGSYKCLLQF